MWQSFKNYFWTAQLIVGFGMAAQMAVFGWKDGAWGRPLSALYAAGFGFLAVMLITAPFALVRAVLHHRRIRQLQQSSSPREWT
jgi:hypothetical protein